MNKKILIAGVAIASFVMIVIIWPKGADVKSENPVTVSHAQAAKKLYAQAVELRQKNELARAKEVYKEIIQNYSDMDNIAAIQQESETVNLQILFSRIEVPQKTVMHEVVVGDSLAKIAKNIIQPLNCFGAAII